MDTHSKKKIWNPKDPTNGHRIVYFEDRIPLFFRNLTILQNRSICLWFSSMCSWMSGWDSTTWTCVPTHPSNHMNLLSKPIGTCDKNLAPWFELYRICFVTGLASRFLRFSSSSTFVCLVVFWKKEIDGDLAMKMSDHWDTLEHTWCVPVILNLRI